MRFVTMLAVALWVAGCAMSTTVNTTDQAAMARFDAFRGGNVTLPMGALEAAEWALYRDTAYEHLASGQWRDLADVVQRKGINNDLSWYYLGRAAEGLGEITLARQYYQRSIERSNSEKASHRCQGAVISLCDGFEFPDVTMARLSQLEAAAPAPKPEAAPETAPSRADTGGIKLLRTGTGFVVNASGAAVTNFHVVQQCGAVSFQMGGGEDAVPATVTASDPMNDLALLKISERPEASAVFQDDERLHAGDDVIVFGYPLLGQLSSSGNLTKGSVTALSGLRDDTRFFQMSAPIQLGNSGGPVLNSSGRVIGVVTSKLNAAQELKSSGDIAQNVNFALKASVLRTFLAANNVSYLKSDGTMSAIARAQTASDGATDGPPAAAVIGRKAGGFTGIVACYR
ncbi:MAG: S1C family serine protease [Alphaproteobacteria bacterium]